MLVKLWIFILAIQSTVEEEANAQLYLKGANSFTFIMDMSGATGLKGDTGDTGATGVTGETGATGAGVTIKGSYNSYEELINEHPTGNEGDSYLVNGSLYVWNGTAWENVGNIKGEKGDKGETGQQGVKGILVIVVFHQSLMSTILLAK